MTCNIEYIIVHWKNYGHSLLLRSAVLFEYFINVCYNNEYNYIDLSINLESFPTIGHWC